MEFVQISGVKFTPSDNVFIAKLNVLYREEEIKNTAATNSFIHEYKNGRDTFYKEDILNLQKEILSLENKHLLTNNIHPKTLEEHILHIENRWVLDLLISIDNDIKNILYKLDRINLS